MYHLYIYGNVVAWWWKGLDRLRESPDVKRRGLYVVKICNTAKGQTWQAEWEGVYPSWDLINKVRRGEISTEEFDATYSAELELKKEDHFRAWNRLSAEAGSRIIALMCHEEPGEHCHRNVLLDWLWEHRQVYAVQNRDALICKECYEAYAEEYEDAYTEREDMLIMGHVSYLNHEKCYECGR